MKTTELIRRCALALPDVDEGVACLGTPLEKRTFRAKKKAFVFFGPKGGVFELMLKLGESIDQARALEAKEPERYKVGATGWTTLRFGIDKPPPKRLLEAWITESHRLMTGANDSKPKPRRAPATKKSKAPRKPGPRRP